MRSFRYLKLTLWGLLFISCKNTLQSSKNDCYYGKDSAFIVLFKDSLSKDYNYFDNYISRKDNFQKVRCLFPDTMHTKVHFYYSLVALEELPIWNSSDDIYRFIILTYGGPIRSITITETYNNSLKIKMKSTNGLSQYYSGNLFKTKEIIVDKKYAKEILSKVNLSISYADSPSNQISPHGNLACIEYKLNQKYLLKSEADANHVLVGLFDDIDELLR